LQGVYEVNTIYFLYGIYFFSSPSNLFGHKNDNDRYELRDIELWPNKYAFLNEPKKIVTGAFNIGLPTGDKKYGFGEG
jgi:hypothetical protein